MFGFGLQSIEPIDMMIVLGIRISFERKNYACSRTVYTKIELATEYGKHPVRTDGGCNWYPSASL
jgi:hypothetical protein